MTEYFPLICQLIVSLAGILVSNKLSNYRIQQLEKKVEKHNTIIERVYKLEQRVEDVIGGKK